MQQGRSAEEDGDEGKTREVGREGEDEGKAHVPHYLKYQNTTLSVHTPESAREAWAALGGGADGDSSSLNKPQFALHTPSPPDPSSWPSFGCSLTTLYPYIV